MLYQEYKEIKIIIKESVVFMLYSSLQNKAISIYETINSFSFISLTLKIPLELHSQYV